MNLWDYIILAVIAAAVVLAVLAIRKKKGGCSCGCGGCPEEKACGKRDNPK